MIDEKKPDHTKEKEGSFLKAFLDYLLIFGIVLIIMIPLRMFVVEPFKIPTASMDPTIAVNDRIFAEKISYKVSGSLTPGEIYTFKDPANRNVTLIKRLIATEGQTIDFQDSKVVVDGRVLDEAYTHGLPSDPLPRTLGGQAIEYPLTIPDGYVWMMG
ncbi:MAG: signal peptidase I, partial [Coriobacteriia bacterium]|nr:signal peptidase I [Coriobacteriia bacterium]